MINRAIVDQCDLLLGIFWTRIGTPTGEADSGTLEEIARVANAGKPVMLYFSKVGRDPDSIDLGQLQRLNAFKKETYPNALTESYKSQIEFRDKFAKQLELKVRDLQKADDSGQPPPLRLTLAAGNSDHAAEVSRSVELPEIRDLETALSGEPDEARKRIETAIAASVRESIGVPVLLAISNTGASGIRNLWVEVSITTSSDETEVGDAMESSFAVSSLLHERYYPTFAEPKGRRDLYDSEGLTKKDNGWEFAFEWGALQPQRVRVVKPPLVIRAKADSQFFFEAKVFADSFPEPVLLKARLDVSVRPKQVTLADMISNLDSLRSPRIQTARSSRSA